MAKTIRAVFSVLGISAAASVANASEMVLYFKNTGNEKIYYSMAKRESNFFGYVDRWKVSGWYVLEAGQRKQVYWARTSTDLTFAFSKRDGYVVYKSRSYPAALDGWFVDPVDAFDGVRRGSASPSGSRDEFIEASLGLRFSDYSFGGEDQSRVTISIPSDRGDRVTSWEEGESTADPSPPADQLEIDELINELDHVFRRAN